MAFCKYFISLKNLRLYIVNIHRNCYKNRFINECASEIKKKLSFQNTELWIIYNKDFFFSSLVACCELDSKDQSNKYSKIRHVYILLLLGVQKITKFWTYQSYANNISSRWLTQ